MKDIPWSRFAHQVTRFYYYIHMGILKPDVIVIIYPATRALNSHSCICVSWHTEQGNHLIKHMRTQIVQNTCTRSRFFLPRTLLDVVSETIVMHFHLHDRSNQFFLYHFLHGQKISIPPSVLEHSK